MRPAFRILLIITLLLAGCTALPTQIEQGAPFDLFAAANIDFVDRLAAKGLLFADTQQLYATGRIVLASS